MRISVFMLACMPAIGAASAALARQDPPPPPSGIVVHLFGQNSIMSNVLPTQPVRVPAKPDTGSEAASPATGVAPAATYVEPSMGDVLHQMFVTGDPNSPPKPSTGRSVQRLSN